MRHRDFTGEFVHVAHAFEYADATARAAATGFVPADVGKLALQLNDFSFWVLSDDDPATWVAVGGGGSGLLYKSGTRVQVVNDASEQTVVSFSVPGGSLESDNAIKVMIRCRIVHSVAGTLTIKLKYGATTMLTIPVAAGFTVADKSTDIEFFITAQGATNSQRASGRVLSQDSGNSLLARWNQEGTASEDSTANKTLAVTVQWDSATPSLDYDQSWVGVELLS